MWGYNYPEWIPGPDNCDLSGPPGAHNYGLGVWKLTDDKIIEIKPIMMFFVGDNWNKIEIAFKNWENYLLVTEEELEELEVLYEYICS